MKRHKSIGLDESIVNAVATPSEMWVSYINDRRERIGKSLSASLGKLKYDLETGNIYNRTINPEFGIGLLRVAQLVESGHITDPTMSDDFEESENCAMILAVGDFLAERGVIDHIPGTVEAING